MKKERGKKIKLREMILPNQKLNYFVGTIILLGIYPNNKKKEGNNHEREKQVCRNPF